MLTFWKLLQLLITTLPAQLAIYPEGHHYQVSLFQSSKTMLQFANDMQATIAQYVNGKPLLSASMKLVPFSGDGSKLPL